MKRVGLMQGVALSSDRFLLVIFLVFVSFTGIVFFFVFALYVCLRLV